MFSSRKKTSSTVASNPSTLGFGWGDCSPFATPFGNKENNFRSNSKQPINRSPFGKHISANIDTDELVMNNERLAKQNQVLQAELQQKDQLIRSLREQIDEAVIVTTKVKLEYNRKAEAEVEMLVMQHKHQLMGQVEQLRHQNEALQAQLAEVGNLASSQRQELKRDVQLLREQLARQRGDTEKLKNDFLEIIVRSISTQVAKEAVIEDLQTLLTNECRRLTQQENSICTTLDMPLTEQTIYQPKHPIIRQNARHREPPTPSPRTTLIRRNK